MTEHPAPLIPCDEAVRQLWDYVESSTSPVDHARIEEHLAVCRRCCGELEFITHLRGLLAAQATDELPPDLLRQLDRFVEELEPMTQDLMHQDEIRQAVRQAYAQIPTGGGEPVTRRSYTAEELALVPPGAVTWALGVGNPVRHAALEPGETVLDVGSGGGIDTILAARRVGPTGRAIGLDLLEEMCGRGRAHAYEAGVDACTEFRRGEMEAIPLPDTAVDVVISNGVINLSARKSRTLAEIFRVLRPGGRICIVDLTVDEDLPPAVLGSTAAWAGCISGALSRRVLLRKLQNSGFADIRIDDPVPFGLADAALYPLFSPQLIDQMRHLLPADRHGTVATAVLVTARRPPA